jgi:hypothetical protein
VGVGETPGFDGFVTGQQGHGLGGRRGTSLDRWLSLLGHCLNDVRMGVMALPRRPLEDERDDKVGAAGQGQEVDGVEERT